MIVEPTRIPDVKVIDPEIIRDDRGFFFESYNEEKLTKAGIPDRFVQDNQSFSRRGVVRGIHYQIEQAQGKLIRCISGEIFDVAVDLRRHSPTFGQWVGETLTSDNRRMLWIPAGFGHAFMVLSETTEVLYKTTAFWAKQYEKTILWNDPALKIDWPNQVQAILSPKDLAGSTLAQAEVYK